MTANREHIITFMLAELEKGMERSAVLPLVQEKWPIPDRTFDRLWKAARDRHSAAQQEAQRKMAERSTQNILEQLEEAIIDKNERMLIASRIARDDKAFPNDRIKALDFLSKMDGAYAPAKKEVTGKDGAPVQVTRIIQFNTRQTTRPASDDGAET